MFQNGNTHGHARNYTLRNKHWPIIQHLERAKMEFQTPPSPSLLLLAARLRISPAWHSRFTELVTEFLATRSAVPWPFFFFFATVPSFTGFFPSAAWRYRCRPTVGRSRRVITEFFFLFFVSLRSDVIAFFTTLKGGDVRSRDADHRRRHRPTSRRHWGSINKRRAATKMPTTIIINEQSSEREREITKKK